MKKVLVFGIFDGSHSDHDAMLKEAKRYGDYLVTVIAQGHIVEHLEGFQPNMDLQAQFNHLSTKDEVDEVIIGDKEKEIWQILNEQKPDVVAFASDQKFLKEKIEKDFTKLEHKPELKNLEAYESNSRHAIE
ncbi:hypothetical protein GW950_01755 [Candidatus Wolfebacteria bacterium]|nr:hypothetical protein [Candidatus Wolfebacteria bacterium]